MTRWEYKTLVYAVEGRFFSSMRFWADTAGNVYGPKVRNRMVGGIFQQMEQLEAALNELSKQGWELVSASIATGKVRRGGCVVLRRAAAEEPAPEE
jgi:hypothetical protein